MKRITKIILAVFILMFAFFPIFNNSFAANTTGNSDISAVVSSTKSASDSFLSDPVNWVNILLIAVGIVIILLAIAILVRLKNK